MYDFKVQQDIWVWASVAMLGFATFFQWRKIVQGAKPAKPIGWFIWSVVSFVTLATLIKAGATDLQFFIPISQLASTLVLFVVTCVVIIRRKAWRKREYLVPDIWEGAALTFCILGVGAWVTFGLEHPMIAIGGNVIANLAGLLPMLLEAFESPESTTPPYWACRGISCIFSTLAFTTDHFNLVGLIPQITGMFIAGSMLAVYLARQRRRTIVAEPIY